MGNNGSRTSHIAQHFETESQWTQSFPRNTHSVHQQRKVLPEKGLHKRLRSTNNGVILHSGGTLSGRHYQRTLSLERDNKSFKIYRTNSVSSNPSDRETEETTPTRAYIPNYGDGNRYTSRYENKKSYKEQIKKFGSEPDLRSSKLISHRTTDRDKFREKKKYKAPLPPNREVLEKPHEQNYQWNEDSTEPFVRRSRLFKSRSELKKRCSSPVSKTLEKSEVKRNLKSNCNLSNVELRNYNKRTEYSVNRLSLPEITDCNGSPQFQSELKEVVQRMKSTKRDVPDIDRVVNNKYLKNTSNRGNEKIKTLDHSINKKQIVTNKLKNVNLKYAEEKEQNNFQLDRGHPSGKECTPEKRVTQNEIPEKILPCKLYYFGMKDTEQDNLNKLYPNTEDVTSHKYNDSFPISNSSESDLSSELEMEENPISSNGIALQLRPILPKKQLEVPRFSPAAAWKQLSAVESNFSPSTVTSEDPPIFTEDRIEKFSRQPPPPTLQTGPRSSYDKSGDSGISGDAGLVGFDDDVKNNVRLPVVINRPISISWTPQQDLGEDESSTDEELQNQMLTNSSVKFTPKLNVFSLSLPRDNQLSSYINRKFVTKQDVELSDSFKFRSGNWFLSRSAPNSLNNGLNSLELHHPYQTEHVSGVHEITINNPQNVSRVMYLPESEKVYRKNQKVRRDAIPEKCNSVDSNLNLLSKPYEQPHPESSSEPEDLQDPPRLDGSTKAQKTKRFSFQSTIRQIERRRLAEKLSKEAEKKEKRRLSELAAMQRVEEEFQKKRAREKASIRQQLRLFSLDNTSWSNDVKDNVPTRSEPDGAVSSATSSPLLIKEKRNLQYKQIQYRDAGFRYDIKKTQPTEVSSEYKQPQREYKDFRSNLKYNGDLMYGHFTKLTTVHPQVTYKMRKVSSHQSESETSNYRKQFAHGVKSNRSGESTYSDDSQPNRNYSPKIRRNNRTSVSR